MGYRSHVLDPDPDSPAAQVAEAHVCAPLHDPEAANELARDCDVVTLEWENADVAALRLMAQRVPVYPSPDVLEIAQHRVREKDTARALGLPTAEYRPVSDLQDLELALRELGTPAVLKTARGGYDGRGQAVIREPGDAQAALDALEHAGELILEAYVPYRMELSVICARSSGGEIATFPLAENRHVGGILDTSVVPARVSEPVARSAREIGEAFAEGLDVVGLLAVEMFLTEDERLLVNEIAPRPHNSGHYTWEACSTSQFEQQLRAVCGLPLGGTELLRPAAMANLLGELFAPDAGLAGAEGALAESGVALHVYGKRHPRPGRKMGHVTALATTPDEALGRVQRARGCLGLRS